MALIPELHRPDGRPEAYVFPSDARTPGRKWICHMCHLEGKHGVRYGNTEIFMCAPINSPDGQAHPICYGHLPDDVVIYDPASNTCRNKAGTNVWTESLDQGSMAAEQPVGLKQ